MNESVLLGFYVPSDVLHSYFGHVFFFLRCIFEAIFQSLCVIFNCYTALNRFPKHDS